MIHRRNDVCTSLWIANEFDIRLSLSIEWLTGLCNGVMVEGEITMNLKRNIRWNVGHTERLNSWNRQWKWLNEFLKTRSGNRWGGWRWSWERWLRGKDVLGRSSESCLLSWLSKERRTERLLKSLWAVPEDAWCMEVGYWPMEKEHESMLGRTEMRMVWWMSSSSLREKKTIVKRRDGMGKEAILVFLRESG